MLIRVPYAHLSILSLEEESFYETVHKRRNDDAL